MQCLALPDAPNRQLPFLQTFDDTALSGGDESRSGPPSDGSIDDDEFF